MRVKWKEITPLNKIPEMYWDGDLSVFDYEREGEIIGCVSDRVGETYFVVLCDDDGVFRKVEISRVKLIGK